MTGCDLRDAVLRDAVLSDVTLERAALSGADLRGAEVDGVALHELDLRGTIIDTTQALALALCHGATVS